jgi:hypothetical protein
MGTTNREESYEKLLNGLLIRVLDMLRFAEAKNAALLAFSSAWIAGIVNLISSGKSTPPDYKLVCLIALPLFIVAAISAILSLLPKLRAYVFTGDPKGHSQNLLYFGDIADLTVDGFKIDVRAAYFPGDDNAPTDRYISDLESQIAINSKIVERKHKMFNVGATSAFVAVAAFSIPTAKTVVHMAGIWLSQ